MGLSDEKNTLAGQSEQTLHGIVDGSWNRTVQLQTVISVYGCDDNVSGNTKKNAYQRSSGASQQDTEWRSPSHRRRDSAIREEKPERRKFARNL